MCNGKLAPLDEDIKGAINYVGGVTVSLLLSMKIIKGTMNYDGGVTVSLLVSMKI